MVIIAQQILHWMYHLQKNPPKPHLWRMADVPEKWMALLLGWNTNLIATCLYPKLKVGRMQDFIVP